MVPNQFSAEMRSNIRRIQEVFTEHRPLSYEEWEDGFISEARPENEIQIWLHAADSYLAFTKNESDAARRREVFKVIAACLTGMHEYAIFVTTHKLKFTVVSPMEVEKILDHYFRKTGESPKS